MKIKPALLWSLACVLPALGDTEDGNILAKGAIYYDSEATLREAQAYIRLRDDDSIKKMTKLGHINGPLADARDIIIYQDDKDATEFVFSDDSIPTTYWTPSRFVAEHNGPSLSPTPSPTAPVSPPSKPKPSSTPTISPTPSPGSTPTVTLSPKLTSTPNPTVSPSPRREHEEKSHRGAPGKKVWHTLPDGTRKWYYEKYGPKPAPKGSE